MVGPIEPAPVLDDVAAAYASTRLPRADLPLVIYPPMPGASLQSWAADHADFIAASLGETGAILFRGFT